MKKHVLQTEHYFKEQRPNLAASYLMTVTAHTAVATRNHQSPTGISGFLALGPKKYLHHLAACSPGAESPVHATVRAVEEPCPTVSEAGFGTSVSAAVLGRQYCFYGVTNSCGSEILATQKCFKNREKAALAHSSLLSIMEWRKAFTKEHNVESPPDGEEEVRQISRTELQSLIKKAVDSAFCI
ncbi:hypothetical protein NDU88_000896 [Pleurodeles waltl]|uniref:Uncharacterized protein n=1 Tax=Pleurodeles waltl TaxID=8319 RepID=A0AAV7UTQ1_PLEWA|nr:hypothetical protein NDU88_000896 [Pleurodeles waltl]